MSDTLTEFVDAEITVSGADSPAAEKKLTDLLEQVDGVAEVSNIHDHWEIHYDPTAVTKKELSHKIEGAGFGVTTVAAAASSPIVDALKGIAPAEVPKSI